MSYSNLEDKVLSFTIGMETAVGKEKKRSLIIEDSSSSSSEALPNKPLLSKSSTAKGVEIEEIPEDNPIYGRGKDGIAWNIKEYNDLWEKIPDKLKSAIRTNNEWMKKFMHSCVNLKKQDKPCEIITPDELIVPPRVSENGQYDFGIAFYNEVFNKLPETLQETYLTFYTTNDGVKNYKKMIDALNRLVADETDFTKTRGFI